jgi:uncharacterized membrane protein YfcA
MTFVLLKTLFPTPFFDEHIYKLIFTGLIAGMVASVVGGGPEILIVPLLVYLGIVNDYKTAVGTSLASLLLPIGIVAVYFYSQSCTTNKSCVKWNYAWVISLSFIIGTFLSYFTVKIDTRQFKKMFAAFMILLGMVILMGNED